jgi:alkylhydroperoxidase family enzyme
MSESLSRRPNLFRAWPDGYKAVQALEETVANCGLDPLLAELVKTRCSQINGCA